MKSKPVKIIISVVLVLLSYGFIIYKIVNLKELKELNFITQSYSLFNLALFLFVILLMILNWSIESVKWKILIEKIQLFSFFNAFKAVLSGITLGIFTPNRIGEIGGRVMHIEKGKRTYGVIATGIGSFAQLITTIITGILGFVLFLILFPDKINVNPLFNNITAGILLLLLLILAWIFLNINKIKPFLLKFSFFKSRTDQLEQFSEIKSTILLKVILLSLLRYIVFISQYFFLLLIFDVHLTFIQAYISISLIYLFITLIPTSTLVELGFRGSLAIFLIGLFSKNILGIIIASSILWIINLAIPAIFGSIFFIKNRYK